MEKKICTKCKSEKDISDFGTRKSKYKDKVYLYLTSACKKCLALDSSKRRKKNPDYQKKWRKETNYEKKWREKNPEAFKAIQKRYREKIKKEKPEELKTYYRLKSREAREKNKEKINEYKRSEKQSETRRKRIRERFKNDIFFRTKTKLRNKINKEFKKAGLNKSIKTLDILGCSIDEFKIYLESKFEPWMTWENKGLYNGTLNYGWDLDHIIPLSTAKNEGELISLFHHTNYQPLCSYANRYIKKDNIIDLK